VEDLKLLPHVPRPAMIFQASSVLAATELEALRQQWRMNFAHGLNIGHIYEF